ncbi:MAG TPA: cutinase family protein [Candidatus Saccharimonadia bacterium]
MLSPTYPQRYDQSQLAGFGKLSDMLLDYLSRCRGHAYGIVALSQGAQAASEALMALDPSQTVNLKWVLLFGNPLHNSRQPQIDAIPNGGKHDGIYTLFVGGREFQLTVPKGLTNRVRSYCEKGDVICDYTKASAASCFARPAACPHNFYIRDGWARDGANWAIVRSRS